jgi:hypothetical protein
VRVDDLHRQVHQAAHRILDELDAGREREARKQVRSLRELSDALLAALAERQRTRGDDRAASL